MKALGWNSFRDEIIWRPGEPGDGVQPPAKLAAFMDAAAVRPLLVLNGQTAGAGRAPTEPTRRAAFVEFAARAADATAARSPIYEIWNEWNRTADYHAKPMTTEGEATDPRYAGQYAALAKQATAAIKRRHPQARVLVGADADDMQWAWLAGVVRQGGSSGADGVSVHLYNQCLRRVRGTDEMVDRLRKLEGVLRPIAGRSVPIYVTEWGWSTGTACPVDSAFVAAHSAQFLFATAALPFVKGTWQYELKDQGGDPADMQQSFGVLGADYRPKPSTCAVREAVRVIRSAAAIGLAASTDRATAVLARDKAGYLAIAWDGRDRGTLRLRAGGTPVRATPLCGTTRAVAPGQPIALGAMPVVVRFGTARPRLSIGSE